MGVKAQGIENSSEAWQIIPLSDFSFITVALGTCSTLPGSPQQSTEFVKCVLRLETPKASKVFGSTQ